jgi:lysophospholipase L1-like esterase
VLTGCASAVGRVPVNRRVAVVGDSITYLSAEDITDELTASGYEPTVVGRIGRSASEVDADVTAAQRSGPAVILLELGTNDITRSAHGNGSAADYERWMSEYIAEFPDSCVIVTTVSSHRPSPAMNQTARSINAWLHTKTSHVVEWDSYEWSQRENGVVIVEPDEVHPTPAGQEALGHLDLAAVKTCLS